MKIAFSTPASFKMQWGAAATTLALPAFADTPATTYGFEEVDGVDIFYREADDRADPTIEIVAWISQFVTSVSEPIARPERRRSRHCA